LITFKSGSKFFQFLPKQFRQQPDAANPCRPGAAARSLPRFTPARSNRRRIIIGEVIFLLALVLVLVLDFCFEFENDDEDEEEEVVDCSIRESSIHLAPLRLLE
jgi:hypothetical protein